MAGETASYETLKPGDLVKFRIKTFGVIFIYVIILSKPKNDVAKALYLKQNMIDNFHFVEHIEYVKVL